MSTERDNDLEIEIKIYKDILQDEHGEFYGNKNTAEKLDSGYVYIYRKYPGGERNEDGTMTSYYQVLNLSNRKYNDHISVTLPRLSFGNPHHFFFAYSCIELSDDRIAALQNNLDKFIKDRLGYYGNSNPYYNDEFRYCRLTYIPISNDQNHREPRYLLNLSPRKSDVEYHSEGQFNTTIYLYNWYGFLEELAENYKQKVEAYERILKQNVRLGDFGRGSSGSYANFQFPRGSLYSFTKSMSVLLETLPGKYKNNLRRYLEHVYGHQHRTAYDYEDFINVTQSQYLEPKEEECKTEIKKIYQLLTEYHKRIHTVLIDYFYDSAHEDEAVALLNKALSESSKFLSKQEIERLIGFFEKIEQDLNEFDSEDLKELTKEIGDGNAFTFFALLASIKTKITLTKTIFYDVILQFYTKQVPNNSPNILVRQPAIYRYLVNKAYKNIAEKGNVVSTDEIRIKSWLQRNNLLQNGKLIDNGRQKNYTFRDACDLWRRSKEQSLSHIDDLEFGFETIDGTEHYFARVQTINADKTVIGRTFGVASNVADAFGKVLDGFNIVNQVYIMAAFQQNELEAVVSIVGSVHGLFERQLSSLIAKKASDAALKRMSVEVSRAGAQEFGKRVAGAIGAFLMAAEMSILCAKRIQAKDTDAAIFYGASAGLAILAGVMAFIPGANILFYALLAVAIICSLIASYLTDDHFDLFFKYCIWGEQANQIPNDPPSWWYLENHFLTEDTDFLVIQQNMTVSDDLKDNLIIENSDTVALNKLEENIHMLQRVRQLTDYETNTSQYTIRTQRARQIRIFTLEHSFVINMEIPELPVVQKMIAILYQDNIVNDSFNLWGAFGKVGRNTLETNRYKIKEFEIDFSQEACFNYTYVNAEKVESFSDLANANRLKIIYAKNSSTARRFASEHNKSMPAGTQYASSIDEHKNKVFELQIFYKEGYGMESVKFLRGVNYL